ncbi:MAG TPA: sigma-70 family RNA polymerase sigma factor [Hanamia sp.]|nr:sigma-70 family RNA polymerase sigma factor [Hanamia sp.]
MDHVIDDNWRGIIEGGKNAFLIVYKDNYHSLFSYGFSLCSDKELTKDCIQEMFIEIWNTRKTINPEVQNVRTYLCTWLRRKINRAQSRAKQSFFKESSTCFEYEEKSYEELLIAFQETEEKKEKLSKALNSLTKKQLEVVRMKYFENLSYKAISEKTLLSPRTVYNIIYISICRLREFM